MVEILFARKDEVATTDAALLAAIVVIQNTQVIAGAGLTGTQTIGAGNITLNVGAGTGLTVGADTVGITNTAVTPNPYGSATQTGTFTVNAQGQLTAAANVTITPAASSITGTGDLTRVSDTNVTLTLGGTPTGALLKATSLTMGWSGTLSAARGGFGTDVSAAAGVPLFAAGVPTFTGTSGTGVFVRQAGPTLTGDVFVTTTPHLVIGHTASLTITGVAANLQVYDATQAQATIGQWSANANGPILRFYKSRNAAIGSHTVVQANDTLMSIRASGDNGTTDDAAAAITIAIDGTPGASPDMPGRITFSTTPDGSATVTDRWVIDSTGVLKPSTTDATDIGTTALRVRNIFLSNTGKMDFGNGDITVTGSTNLLTFAGATTGYSFDTNVTSVNFFSTGYSDYAEIASPASPAADHLRLFAKDIGGATHLISRDSGGTEIDYSSSASATGRLIAVQVFTTGTAATYTRTSGVTKAIVRGIGGGGSGGGVANPSALQIAAAGGGGGGGFSQKYISPGSTETYTVGAGGAAPSAGANNGNTGGTTTFGAHISVTGGAGGTGCASGTAAQIPGGAGGVGSSGDANMAGAGGGLGVSSTATNGLFLFSGFGGMASNGGGGAVGQTNSANGIAGGNYGGGGSGAASYNGAGAFAGGAGAGGLIIVFEFS